jgi:uncharacterized lipoprotein YehR (DUF1307 family)
MKAAARGILFLLAYLWVVVLLLMLGGCGGGEEEPTCGTNQAGVPIPRECMI